MIFGRYIRGMEIQILISTVKERAYLRVTLLLARKSIRGLIFIYFTGAYAVPKFISFPVCFQVSIFFLFR